MNKVHLVGLGVALLGAGCAHNSVMPASASIEFTDVNGSSMTREASMSAGAAPAAMRRAADSFIADRKARRVGEIVTVIIVEDARVSQTARTKADRDQTLSGQLLQKDSEVQRWDGSLSTEYEGGGSIERSGRLLGRLAVVVLRVDDFGNLRVRGEQDILVNGERQEMRLEGIVRPEDIGADNTIPSWRITGARISLIGRGFLSRKQSPGIVQRLIALFGA
jgi:flagellar L-ring protein FlgH